MDVKRYAWNIMEEAKFDAVKGKYFTNGSSKIFLKPQERIIFNTLSESWSFVVYDAGKRDIKDGLVKRWETEDPPLGKDYFEVPESQLPFDPVTLRLRKSE